jgi:hypothetical protein
MLLTRKIVEFFTMFSDQRERVETNRAAARIGWRPCRPVFYRLSWLVFLGALVLAFTPMSAEAG